MPFRKTTVITQENFAGGSTCNFRKGLFVSITLKLMVLYKLNNQPLMTFYDYLYNFIEAKKWILLLVILILKHAANPDCHKYYQNLSIWLNFQHT